MKRSSLFGLFGNSRRRGAGRKRGAGRVDPTKLLVEQLEDRTLLSVIAPVQTTGAQDLTTNVSGSNSNGFSTGVNPQAAVDPANHLKVVEFNTWSPANGGAVFNDLPTSFLEGRSSNDGGKTWSVINSPTLGHALSNLGDPTPGPASYSGQFTNVSSPSVAFDDLDNVYVTFTEHGQGNGAGVVLLNKYNFSNGSPTVVFENHILYQWFQQDPAFNPVVAIDNNQPSVSDPEAPGSAQTDPLAGNINRTIFGQSVSVPEAVYVAWNVNQTGAFGSPPQSFIAVEASDDGGQTFSSQQYINSPTGVAVSPTLVQFLSANNVQAQGIPIQAAFGTFYANSADAGHDLVTLNSQGFSTVEINSSGAVVGQATTALATGIVPRAFAVGQFTSSPLTDLALIDENSTGQFFLTIYAGQANGTLSQLSNTPYNAGTPSAIVAGKFVAGSNNTDLVVADSTNGGNGEVQVFLGDGSGNFTSNGTFRTDQDPSRARPVSLAVGRFNSKNDSFLDLVVANQVTNDVQILIGQGNGSFATPSAAGSEPLTDVPLEIQTADFNRDAVSDVAVLTNGSGQAGAGHIFLGNGNGGFTGSNTFTVTPGADSFAVGDFNADGSPDIVSADVTGATSVVSFVSGNGDGSFQPISQSTPAAPGPIALATTNPNGSFVDINGDGPSDLAAVNAGATGNVVLYLGNRPVNKATGSEPRIVFTQGTSAPTGTTSQVPGGELMFVWNGGQNFSDIETNISTPNGNLANPTPPVSSQVFFGSGGAIVNGTGSNPIKPGITSFTLPVNISDGQFASLSDLAIGLNLLEPNDGDLAIQLLVPSSVTAVTGITAINLVNSGINASGGNTGDGLGGLANLGLINSAPQGANQYDSRSGTFPLIGAGGTIFQANAPRSITDKSDTPNRVGIYVPEGGGTLQELNSAHLTADELDGTWTLQVTNFNTATSTGPQQLFDWTLNFTGGISTKGFGTSRVVPGAFPLPGSFDDVYPTSTSSSGPKNVGIGPGIAIAVDDTLGAHSPFEGRMYIAYTGFGLSSTNVYLMSSSDNGVTWSQPVAFTDDSVNTNFSQGDRGKYGAEITVDQATGTLVLEYYDGRYDPIDNPQTLTSAPLRVANAVQTSIDGGVSFSSASFVNELNTGNLFFSPNSSGAFIEPVPGQASQSAAGWGDRPASVMAFDGNLVVVFASNANSQYGQDYSAGLTVGAAIFAATGTYQNGPSVIKGDEGPVTHDSSIVVAGSTVSYNNTFAADGTRQLTGFVVTFDRPIDPASFAVPGNAIKVMYRSPTTPANQPGTLVPVANVTPVVFLNGNPNLPTGFLVTLATPQSAVGTYSYSVGPLVFDRVRTEPFGGTLSPGNPMDQDGDGGGPAGQPDDAFAAPQPLKGGVPFQLPYDPNTEPLIVPGPHVIYSYSPVATPPTASQVDSIENGTIAQTDNVVVDNGVASINILFDRDMNPNTFNPSTVLSIMGPNGPVSGPFTFTADPAGTDPLLAKRTFKVSFPVQTLSGTYTVQFAPTGQDTKGNAVDTNLNAGLYVLNGFDPTNTQTQVTSYTNNTPVQILPGQTVVSSINVSDAYEILQDLKNNRDIQVQLNIQYPTDTDLQAKLIAPDGTAVQLFTNVGQFGGTGGSSGFLNTIFDDNASAPIELAGVPFDTGPFNPQKPLSTLVGKGSEGTWQLAITDTNTNTVTGPAQLTYWTLRLPHATPGTGLGEAVADQYSASFRIFAQAPNLPASSNSYTAIGPASANGLLFDPATNQYDIKSPNAVAGQVNAIAVDPADPTGNTVYVGGGGGGIWKTMNFMTTSPNGPTWIQLANFGPTNSLNISGLAIAPVNNNPNQSVIFAITGNSNLYAQDKFATNTATLFGVPGVGLLRSTDGGKTWVVLDGLNNVDGSGNILPITNVTGAQFTRDHSFDGAVGFKVVVDPTPTPTGFVVYAAFSGPNGGLYRSINSGNTWTLIKSGNCTDVVLPPAAVDVNGNLETLYAGFQSVGGGAGQSGVYMTTSALTTTSLNLMAGGLGVNSRVHVNFNPAGSIPITNDSVNPNGLGGRIVLATPALTSNPLENTFYQQFLYAAVEDNSSNLQLYMTKDAGANWTHVILPVKLDVPKGVLPDPGIGTNDTATGNQSYDANSAPLSTAQTAYDIALAVDPSNPHVVYLGTSAVANGFSQGPVAEGPLGGLVRIDTTTMFDAYAMIGYLNSAPDGGNFQFGVDNPITDFPHGNVAVGSVAVLDTGAAYGIVDAFTHQLETGGSPSTSNYFDLFRDPNHPFVNPSTLQIANITSFNNDGFGSHFGGFNYFEDNSTSFHTLLALPDPITGGTRLILGDDQGVFTGVDDGTGNPDLGDGFATSVSGTRNGNLQLATFLSGAAQPSILAANVAGALYYATGPQVGVPQSTSDILSTGNLHWSTVQGSFNPGFAPSGIQVATDQTGTGDLYQTRQPNFIDQFPFLPPDFFELTQVVGNQPQQITSRTTGLLGTGVPVGTGLHIAVNPVDPTAALIGEGDEVFRTSGPTTGFGKTWFQIQTDPAQGQVSTLVFGAPDPLPQESNVLDDFIYYGTQSGAIEVSTNGGGAWTNISHGLDGLAVEQIVTDPARGSHDAYAVTLGGVYFMPDSTAANATWIRLDDTTGKGPLNTLTRGNFNNPNDPVATELYFTSIAADWRYAIPNTPGNPAAGTHPVLYVGANGGVYRSLDQGTTWTYYPDVNSDGAVNEGGNLPNATVTALNLVLGNVNPATGFTDPSAGLNQLVVTTYGSGEYAIRLNLNAQVDGQPLKNFLRQPNSGPQVQSLSEIVPIPGTQLTGIKVTFTGAVDPTTFTLAEIDSLKNPSGAAVPVASVTPVEPPPGAGQTPTPNIFIITFATPQTQAGNYTLTIGPNITDFSGNPLTQAFTGTLFFTPDVAPTISPATIAKQVIAPGGSDVIHFTIGSSQFPNQLVVTTGSSNQSLLPLSSLVLTNTGNNYTLTINAPAGTNTGSSTVQITVTDPLTLATSESFGVTIDVAPVIPPINANGTITLPHTQFPTKVALGASSPVGNALTYSTSIAADSPLFDLQSKYRFTSIGVQTAGATAFVLHSNQPGPGSSGYYLIRPSDGAVFPYDGSGSYSHSFANGTALGVFGPNLFLDPTILLNAQPPIDYITLNTLENKYGFTPVGYQTAGATAFVLKGTKPGPGVMNFYLIRSTDGALFAYDGSSTYSGTFANGTPLAVLGVNVYNNPNLLINAKASPAVYAQLYQLNQQLDITSTGGNHPVTMDGHNAVWFFSPILNQFGQHWYTLTSDGTLRAWQGYPDSTVGATVATVDTSVYGNPALLVNATAAPAPAATASVDSGGNLTVGLPSPNYVGSFFVTVTATDGLLSSKQTVLVTSTDAAPMVTVTGPGNTAIPQGGSQSFPHLSYPQTDTVATGDADGDTVTTTVSASSFSPAFALEQQFGFKAGGYATAGAKAFVLVANQANSFGDPFYLINSAGNVYAYDNSGSYSHTFANVTPIASLGASVFNDPALLLNAQPTVDYPTLASLEQQFQFQNMGVVTSAGVNALVLKTTQPTTAVQGLYLLRTNGQLFAYDGSPTFAQTFNGTPLANLGAGVYANPNLLFNAQAPAGIYPVLSQLMQQFAFQPVGYQFAGATAYVLSSPTGNNAAGNPYYLLRSDGALFAYDGSGSYGHTFQNGTPIANLSAAVFNNPLLLLNGTAPQAATGVTAGLSGGTITLNAPASFVGTFEVTVAASDGIKTTTQTFVVNSTDTQPVPNVIPDQTASKLGAPLQVTLGATDAENDPVTFQAKAVGYSAAFNLQQLYHFTAVGMRTDANNVQAFVLHSNLPGAVGGFYILSSTGGVFASDGSATFGQVFANSKNFVAQLDPSVFTTPTLLTNAQPPSAVPAGVVSVSGNKLTISVLTLPVGTVFQVLVTANDGAETSQIAFLVTVTA